MAVDTADPGSEHAFVIAGAGENIFSEYYAAQHMHVGSFSACGHVFCMLCHPQGALKLRGVARAAGNAVSGLLYQLALFHQARPGIFVRLYFADRCGRRRGPQAPGQKMKGVLPWKKI